MYANAGKSCRVAYGFCTHIPMKFMRAEIYSAKWKERFEECVAASWVLSAKQNK